MPAMWILPIGKPTGGGGTGEATNEGATAGEATSVLTVLGLDVVSTDVSGIFGRNKDKDNYLLLKIFGSEWSEEPDPYLEVFLENFLDYGLPADAYNRDDFSNWSGRYTLLNQSLADSGFAGAASSVIHQYVEIESEEKYTDPLFFYEPGVLLGANRSAYGNGIDAYKEDYNINYNPLQVSGWSSSEYQKSTNDYQATIDMANGVYTTAKEIEANGSPRVRFNDIMQNGMACGNFALGILFAAEALFNGEWFGMNPIDEMSYCTGISIAESGIITITNEYTLTRRHTQYLSGIATLATTGRTYASYGNLAREVGIVIMDLTGLAYNQRILLENVGIKLVDIAYPFPNTPYLLINDTTDDLLGCPFVFGQIYGSTMRNILGQELTEFDFMAYWLKWICHVREEYVEEAMGNMLGDYASTFSISDNYEENINQLIEIGADFYRNTYMGRSMWQAIEDGEF